jgi:hypothetical protein
MQMTKIEALVSSIRDDRRSDYLFPTKGASDAVGCHPNKFHDWWYRNREKLEALAERYPGETAAEMAAILASALSRMQNKNT